MVTWSGYLSNDTINEVIDVLVEERLTSRASIVALLSNLSNRVIAQLPAENGLPDRLRLVQELSHLNSISMLRGGEVPMAIFLSNVLRQLQDQKRAGQIKDAVLELEANAPSLLSAGAYQKKNKSRSHARFDSFKDTLSKRNFEIEDNYTESVVPDSEILVQPELTILKDEKLPIGFVQTATIAAKSVFKLIVHRHFSGVPNMLGDQPDSGTGTAWVIGPGIGITNHHVFAARGQFEPSVTAQDLALQVASASIVADFYDADVDQNGPVLGEGVLLASNEKLDYAIFKLPTQLEDREPLSLVSNPLLKSSTAPVHSRVNIIQHPNGLPMQLAIRNNYVMSGDALQLTYLSDTEAGSSGSPVLDDRWQVAALHIGGRENDELDFELMGMRVKHENIGVAISAILKDLETKVPNVHHRITNI